MSLLITFTANGTPCSAHSGQTIGDFLRERGFKPGLVVVEHNGHPLTPAEPDRTLLQNGDKLEIVRIVAGG